MDLLLSREVSVGFKSPGCVRVLVKLAAMDVLLSHEVSVGFKSPGCVRVLVKLQPSLQPGAQHRT